MIKGLNVLRKIKSVSFATVNNGSPEVRIIDVMLIQDNKLYFVTARGKAFYKQLMDNMEVAISGMTKDYLAVKVKGKIKQADREYVDIVFNKNPMMNKLYPGKKKDILEAFCLYEGVGEIFNLGSEHPYRDRFAFGKAEQKDAGYIITNNCTACGICKEACPVDAITEGDVFTISPNKCIECGRCFEQCPSDAILNPVPF